MKKIIVIFLIFLFFISTVTVNKSVYKKNITSHKLVYKKENYNVQDMDQQFIDNNFLGKWKTCFGYRVYPNPDLLVSFEIDNPETLITIGTPISSDKIAGGTWVNDIWWCCEYSASSNSNIWTVYHVTGDMTLIGTSGEGLHGLAYDDTTGIMYACGSMNLFTIDMATGAATLVGSFGISGCVMIGIACDGYGNMYGEDLHTDSFYSIDPTTGTATLIGPLGLDLNYGQDIAIDKEDGTCYLAAFTVHAGNEGALYTCDLATGVPTKIGNFGTVPTQITGFVIPYSLNKPPDKPKIDGPIKGGVGVEYEYNFSISDPDEDSMHIRIDWELGPGKWDGPFPPDSIIKYNYTWRKSGAYIIRAQTIDTNGAMSDWGELTVTMPRNKATFNQLLLQFLDRFPLLHRLLNLLNN